MKGRIALESALLFIMLTGAAVVSPQPKPSQIRVEAQVKPENLTIGDRTNLKVTFDVAPEILITPSFSATGFEHWEMLAINPAPPRRRKDGNVDRSFQLTLIPWSATVTATPELPFRVELPGQWIKTIIVSPQRIAMESVLTKAKDTGDLRPLRGLIVYRSLLPILLVSGLLLLAVIAWLIWRRRRRHYMAQAGPPPQAPAEAAREALERLLASDLLATKQIKLFYTLLSEIPRRYIEGRFGIPALDRTTLELLPELRRRPELRELYPAMREFLESCDLVKFAKYTPGEEEIRRDVECARHFVETTALLDRPQERQAK